MSDEKGRFILTFPLKTELFQEHILYKRFRIGERLYNQFLDYEIKKYREMTKTRKYRNALNEIVSLSNEIRDCTDKDTIKNLKAKRKDAYQIIYDIKKENNWSKFGFCGDMKKFRGHYKKNLNSQICNNLAVRCFNAFEKIESENMVSLLKGEEPMSFVHFKRKDSLRTLCGQQNTNGIRCIKTNQDSVYRIVWQGLEFNLDISKYSTYTWQAFRKEICYCAIKRTTIKGQWHYYVQITFKGSVPVSFDKETGEVKHPLGEGKVGLYFQANSLTAVNENGNEKQFSLTMKDDNEKCIKELQALMANSRRTMNPDNYNEDGTIKEGKLFWKNSNRYRRYRAEMVEIYRKQDEKKKLMQEIIANEIISMGNVFVCNDMSFKFLQSKIGRVIQSASPGMLKATIDRKLGYHDIEIKKIPYSALKDDLAENNVDKSQKMDVAKLLLNYC